MAGLEVIDARICPQCKRKFVVPLGGREDYVYKLHQKTRTDNFCSCLYKEDGIGRVVYCVCPGCAFKGEHPVALQARLDNKKIKRGKR